MEIIETGTPAPAVSKKVILINPIGFIKSDVSSPVIIFLDIFVSADQDNVELQIKDINVNDYVRFIYNFPYIKHNSSYNKI